MDDVEGHISRLIDSAVEWVESEYVPRREKAWRYYNGECDVPAEDGRSSIVVQKLRDAVRMVEPALLRPFLTTRRPVEFIPRAREDDALAAQMSDACCYEFFTANDGRRVIRDAIRDCAIGGVAVAKVWWDVSEVRHVRDFSNVAIEALDALGEAFEEVEAELNEDGTASGTFVEVERKGRLRVVGVPLDEFFIDESATSLEDALCVAHRREVRVSDVVALGFDADEVLAHVGSEDRFEYERQERRNEDGSQDDEFADPMEQPIVLTEAYVRVDGALRKAWAIGPTHFVLRVEDADEVPFADFRLIPIPHAFWGESFADFLSHDQDVATVLYRQMIDNAYLTNQPRPMVNDAFVNMDDLLNSELGAPVRIRNDVSNAINWMTVPFMGDPMLRVLSFVDENADRKAGVSRAGQGLDPDVMQSTTKAAVDAAVRAATGNNEVMVRSFADGLRRLFRLMARELHLNAPAPYYLRIRGEYVPVDPSQWKVEMDMDTNVGLGTGQPEQKIAALEATLGHQKEVIAQYGLNNPFVTFKHVFNTIEDLQVTAGLSEPSRYFQPVTRESEAAFRQELERRAQQAAQQQAQGGQNGEAFVQAEQIKAQAQKEIAALKNQMEMMKFQMETQSRYQLEIQELRRKLAESMARDDLERDRMAQDRALRAAEIAGKHQIAVNEQAIRAEQAAPRGEA